MSSKPTDARNLQRHAKSAERREARRLALSDEQRLQVREMRKLGFAPRKGAPTQKHFERYTAFVEAQAAHARAAAINAEIAVFNDNGGVMLDIFEQLNNPKIKPTARAAFIGNALKAVALGATLSDKMRIDAAAGSNSLPEDDRIDSVLAKLGGGE
ncbi:hypothetical protein [Citrobacter sp. Marseille-Q6884]|uniref:hypothetical protein n=1 Tax=Citrobacter sp. Marseille-Q6884 TaxID=2956786 RepID=UPI0021B4AF91|nr:hypothetical protein [Citrobacter sp. Marseille-Q6884]